MMGMDYTVKYSPSAYELLAEIAAERGLTIADAARDLTCFGAWVDDQLREGYDVVIDRDGVSWFKRLDFAYRDRLNPDGRPRLSLTAARESNQTGAGGNGQSATPAVRVGQVWADNDKRMAGRKLRIVALESDNPCPVAICEVLTNRDVAEKFRLGDARGRRVRIRLDRFRPTSTGYRLVEDVPTKEAPG